MRSKSSKRINRLIAAISAGLTMALGLVGCSNESQEAEAPPTPTATVFSTPAPSLAELDELKITETEDAAPKVTATWPFSVDTTSVKVLKEGAGDPIKSNAIVSINYVGVNGRDGNVFDSSYKYGLPVSFSLEQVIPGFQKGLAGQKVGATVVIAVTGADGYVGGNPDAGIEDGDTLIFVCEIVDSSLSGPTGDPVAQKEGQPVVTDSDGVPTVSVPNPDTPPTELVVQPIIKGKGKAVKADSKIMANYIMVDYQTGKTLASTYESGPQVDVLNNLITGWREGLVGQTVGSRVLLVVPSEKAYPDGNANPKIEPDTDLVFVVDLLHVQ